MSWSTPPSPAPHPSRLPLSLTESARYHYWQHIHRSPSSILVVDSRNWQVGRNVYFVPYSPHAVDRHSINKDGYVTDIYELKWHEFLLYFPRPQ